MKKKRIILFLDSGDTLIDEGSEVRNEDGIVVAASFIPGAKEVLRELKNRGYCLVLVADGAAESFKNVYSQHGMDNVFSGYAISGIVGEEKPSPLMFQRGMDSIDLKKEDKDRIYMVGNNIKRDVIGANSFGIHSILNTWSKRYPMEPEHAEETPEYRISNPRELLELVDELERIHYES